MPTPAVRPFKGRAFDVITYAVETGLVAHAGGGQANALQLDGRYAIHEVATCATLGDSVKLPTAVKGQTHRVTNGGAATMRVYGADSSTINGIATATGIILEAGQTADYCATSDTTADAVGTWRVDVDSSNAFDPLAIPALGPASESVTAHAGGTQAAGLQLLSTKIIHIIAVCATLDDSVLLPTVVADAWHRIINRGVAALRVFGNGTSTINGIASATGVLIPVGQGMDFHGGTAGAAGTWVGTAFGHGEPLAAAGQAAVAAQSQQDLTYNGGGTPGTTIAVIPDPADTPADADALRDDLVTNVLPKLRDALASATAQLALVKADVAAEKVLTAALRAALVTAGIAKGGA